MHLAFALALLAGCPFPAERADLGPHCDQTVTDVALDEVTPIGVVAADVLARLPGHEDTVLVYADGTRSDLALDFAPGATARFVDQEAVYPEDGTTIDIAVECEDYVAVDVDLGLTTADGQFAESLATEVQATAESLGGIVAELDLDALAGTFDIGDFTDAGGWTDAVAWVAVELVGDGTTRGSIDGQVSGEDECDGDECSAWASSVAVGTWGGE